MTGYSDLRRLQGPAWSKLNHNQQKWLKLYLGNSEIHHNAARCYMAVYGIQDPKVARAAGSRMLRQPFVKEVIRRIEEAALDRLNVDAEFVLGESLRLYRRAMADEGIDQVTVSVDQSGQETIKHKETRSYDPATASKMLQLIGQHKQVQAFQVNIEHSHTHILEQRLAARGKVIEGRAIANQGASDPALIEHTGSQANPAPADPGSQGRSDPGNHQAPGRGSQANDCSDPGPGSDQASDDIKSNNKQQPGVPVAPVAGKEGASAKVPRSRSAHQRGSRA